MRHSRSHRPPSLRTSGGLLAAAALLLIGLASCTDDGAGTGEIVGECLAGSCTCPAGFNDCDGDTANGCEVEGSCPVCTPGYTRSCYGGAPGTEGVGICRGGLQTCSPDGSAWGLCEGAVWPAGETCGNGADDDCDGQVDEDVDQDGDGYTNCGGDCCDSASGNCGDPALVNPGAFDVVGNEIDDDCDGSVDDAVAESCASTESFSGTTATAMARAMGLCQDASTNPWGLVSAQLLRADGTGSPDDVQVGVLSSLGGTIDPQEGPTMAAMSSGTARGVGQPGYISPIEEESYRSGSIEVTAPYSYTSQHGGQLQTYPGCPAGDPRVNDSVLLRLKLKAPTNAQGFSFRFRFLTAEYPIYLCTEFNDFFLALLQSEHADIPADGNISFDASGNPLSVNNAFFTTCEPLQCTGAEGDWNGDGCADSLSCQGGVCQSSSGACPDGAGALAGYTRSQSMSGGTSWLTTQAPVKPGETVTLDLHIWDTSDQILDSLVLLDQFEWRIEPSMVVTEPIL